MKHQAPEDQAPQADDAKASPKRKAKAVRKRRPKARSKSLTVMGRPPLLTTELQEAICARLRVGDRPVVAAARCGVPQSCFWDWMLQGKEKGSRYATFRVAVTTATMECESRLLDQIHQGDGKGVSFGPGKAALEILQRRFPRHWSQRVKSELDDGLKVFLDCAERVCREKDCTAVFIAICEEIARSDSEGEAPDLSEREPATH